MKKKLVIFILVCVLLVGCGKQKTTSDQSDQSDTQENNVEQSNEDTSAETIPIEEGFIDSETSFDCTRYIFSCTGIKEYTELPGESYTDQPEAGKVYLVLFLNVKNHTTKNLYFTPNGLESEVDGEKIETSYLCNEPDGYQPIFGDIGLHNEKSGFIVWQVPEDWSELSFTYTGLEFSEQIKFSGKITKEMLFDPPEIEE